MGSSLLSIIRYLFWVEIPKLVTQRYVCAAIDVKKIVCQEGLITICLVIFVNAQIMV